MAGRPKIIREKPRSDIGAKRGKYKSTLDNTGKTGKENKIMTAFWRNNKLEDMMLLTGKELDDHIDKWLEDYKKRQIKRNQFWWFPEPAQATLNDVRNKRTDVDKGWHL